MRNATARTRQNACRQPNGAIRLIATLAIAASWLSLARQQIAMDELVAIWSQASTDTLADTSRRRFQYPRDLHRLPFKMPARRWDAALQERESISLTS
jgi:hypothetical protein